MKVYMDSPPVEAFRVWHYLHNKEYWYFNKKRHTFLELGRFEKGDQFKNVLITFPYLRYNNPSKVVGERGVTVSGGQKQRIAIAVSFNNWLIASKMSKMIQNMQDFICPCDMAP